ncbi:16S rRNA m(2)G 1207 methyltransferase [Salsuginibacillus halophilus]|uniref:16S rRNA m(2)G 1207 methyltransferase n=1 Tax=Salsuginibacillus halophilus TaxID=517424 RepID=A0A2P8H543_9BACI|nr:methyltransferase [Salsuginibacillus halophilus]PSL41314.1 16S rRNA m(2)G 1207 methyltransferase [Salsuginibacillus halophilus]
MSDHYFTEQPSVESRPEKIRAELRGRNFMFTTDQGVFSKGELDTGSELLVEEFMFPKVNGPIADVGCGYGAIGLPLAAETERAVWLFDVNERALALAEANRDVNGLANIHVQASDGLQNTPDQLYAAIVTNPPIRAGKAVVHRIFEEAAARLVSSGEFWVVIRKKQGAPSAKEKLATLFSEVELVKKNKGYYILKAVKY